MLELIPHGGVGNALPDIAQQVLGVAHELVAGVQIAPRGNRHVLGAGAAAGKIQSLLFRNAEKTNVNAEPAPAAEKTKKEGK